MKRTSRAITSVAILASVVATTAYAEKIKINMPSTFAGSLTQLGTAGVRFADTVNLTSGGDIEVKFYDPNALIPPLEIYDNVSTGAVDAGWSTSGYWGSKNSALNLFAAVPFGLIATEINGWIRHGGGQELWDELADGFGLKNFMAGNSGVQMGGWFNKEIRKCEHGSELKQSVFKCDI